MAGARASWPRWEGALWFLLLLMLQQPRSSVICPLGTALVLGARLYSGGFHVCLLKMSQLP